MSIEWFCASNEEKQPLRFRAFMVEGEPLLATDVPYVIETIQAHFERWLADNPSAVAYRPPIVVIGTFEGRFIDQEYEGVFITNAGDRYPVHQSKIIRGGR